MAHARYLSPIVPSTDLDASVRFLEQALGFRLTHTSDWYRICEKDGLTIHLQNAGESVGECAVYLEVDDLDAAWADAQPHLGETRVRAPHEQPYGMREFHVDVPHTKCLFFVGQPMAPSP